MTGHNASWWNERTALAPKRLRDRAAEMLDGAAARLPLANRLADSGRRALDSAVAAGAGREAALDLLTADALITLSLLATAQDAPGQLGALARTLRLGPI